VLHSPLTRASPPKDTALEVNLQGVVEAVEQSAQCRAKSELDDLRFAEVLPELVEDGVADVLGIGGYLHGLVTHEAVHFVETGTIRLQNMGHGLGR
jgi:hypothetical protein